MAETGGRGMERRLDPLRGRLALSRAAEDLQRGLPFAAGLLLLLALLRWLDWVPVPPGTAAGWASCLLLAFPAAGVLLRRTSTFRVAALVDERLGLAERVGTALALETGEATPTPLGGLVGEDAVRALDRVPSASLRRAFRPALLGRPLLTAGGALLLAVLLLRAEPWRPSETPKDPAEAYRQAKEKEETAKAVRRVKEAARTVEDLSDPREAALRAVAAEMRRRAEEMLRRTPPKAEAMAAFQKMGELARERQEMLAGVDAGKLAAWKAEGLLGKPDRDLEKLLAKLLQADLRGLDRDLAGLDAAMKGAEGAGEWNPEMLAALKERLEDLAKALERGASAMEGREALKEGLRALGDAELLRELAERVGKLMETLREQGWEACKDPRGLEGGGLDGLDPGESITLTDEQLRAMIDRLKELQALADLGKLSFCQNCGLSGGT